MHTKSPSVSFLHLEWAKRKGEGETHRRIEKQKAQGTGLPVGPRTTHCIVTLEEVDSNACLAKASYRSTTETVSRSCPTTTA